MDVASIVVTTIIVFLVVDFSLRMLLKRAREARIIKEREQALETGLRLDASAEAQTLTRVDLEHPEARILAVDDEKTVLDSMRKMLVLGGYSIDTVEKGAEALGLLQNRDYDFVFTDLKMPGMDGVELTRAVKHLRPDIDVIVITGYATIETAVETVKSGAMDYVQKPFTEDELLEFIDSSLMKRRDRLTREMRHKIRLIGPGIGESASPLELNVPAGAFISPEHAWARIELNGIVRIGPDDLVRKMFPKIDLVELPGKGAEIKKGEPLFSVGSGELHLDIPSPLSGKIVAVNSEHAKHPDWLASRPFELSWMCGIEPKDLAGELSGLRIGSDAITWYQQELDRFGELADRPADEAFLKGPIGGLLRKSLTVGLAMVFLALPFPGNSREAGQAGSATPQGSSDSPAASAAFPDEIVFRSSVGDVLFPHKKHRKMRCGKCHHQVHAEELNTPHEEYLKSSWINCQTCHSPASEKRSRYYRCSDCHHSAPQNIADETLSSKVVIHKSCWKCHKTGTGVKASEGCVDCHVKEETVQELSHG